MQGFWRRIASIVHNVGPPSVENLGVVCIVPSYRLVPERPFPTSVLDAWDAVKFVAANAESFEANPARGFIVGSIPSGANIAAVITQLARDKALSPPLSGQYLSLPFLLWRRIVPSKYKDKHQPFSQNAEGPILTEESLNITWDRYRPDMHSPLLNLTSSKAEL